MQETRNGTPASGDAERYHEYYLSEQEGVYLYRELAEIEDDQHLAELYRRIADIEQRHAALWKGYLEKAGEAVPTYIPNWRIRTLLWLAKRMGTGAVLSTISSMEQQAMSEYDAQPEAVNAGLPADERSHARLFSYLLSGGAKGGIAGPLLAQFEGRHR